MPAPTLHHRYADALPDPGVPWEPTSFPRLALLRLNTGLAEDLGLDVDWLSTPAGLDFLAGRSLPQGAKPIAQAYAGHQFGHFNPQLGDGRAALLGEVETPSGALHDLSLKGSGRTVYSRGGDGKATLGPMMREYIMAHAMHHLGVPTTRSLAVLTTGEPIWRERQEPGAILVRSAASHIRVGSFAFFGARRDLPNLQALCDHAIERHAPQAASAPIPALGLLAATCEAQAELIARWMSLGFIHGVMNTDNMTISGETIDYGPCAFMEATDPAAVFSSIDHHGRYAYGQQPGIGMWNLARLAEALLPIIPGEGKEAAEAATEILRGSYGERFEQAYLRRMAAKLGIQKPAEADRKLISDFLELLEKGQVDFTLGFRRLSTLLREGDAAVPGLYPDGLALGLWSRRWRARLAVEGQATDQAAAMDLVNPEYIPRNHRVEEALAAAETGDLTVSDRLMSVLSKPFTASEDNRSFSEPADSGFTEGYQTFCGT